MAAPTPPRKRPAAKRGPTPPRKIQLEGLDLDALERESPHEPFAFCLAGEQFYIEDPTESEWQGLVAVHPQDVVANLRAWMGEEDFERFSGLGLKLWKLKELIDRVQAHFGLTPQAAGEDDALPTS